MTAAITVAVGLLALVAGAAGGRKADPSFAANAAVPAGRVPCAAATADVNADGHNDLAVADCRADSVGVLLGTDAGGFRSTPVPRLAVGKGIVSVLSADFNGDRAPDLAVLSASELAVLLGDGTGRFTAAPGSPLKLSGTAAAITTDDVNGDGRIDLVCTRDQDERKLLVVLLGAGSGRFTRVPDRRVRIGHGWPAPLLTSDFNGDGHQDVALGHGEGEAKTTILFGNGAGGFRASSDVVRGALLAVGNLDGDGKTDLAVATVGRDGVTLMARALLGTGAGRFRPARAPGIPVGPGGGAGVAADLDGDDRLDLAVANYWTGLSVLLGTGSGRLRPAEDSPFPLSVPSFIPQAGAGQLVAADLNGDNRVDIAAPGRSLPDGGLRVLWQAPPGPAVAGGGTLPGPRAFVFATPRPISLLAADGGRVAAMTSPVKRKCGRIVVWTPPRRRTQTFKTEEGCYDATIPPHVTGLALGGGQLAWIVESGGNSLELTLYATKLAGGRARQIDYANNSNGASGDPAGSWVGYLQGEGPLLVYNSWTLTCTVPPDYGCSWNEPTLRPIRQRLLRIGSGRRMVVNRGAASFPVSAVGGGRMAVRAGGVVTVLGAGGSRGAVVPAIQGDPPRTVALSRTRLAVERTFELDLYDPATGRKVKSMPLGSAAGLPLVGVNSRFAMLRGSRRVVLVRLSDGKLISLAHRKPLVAVRLSDKGLFYAYNVQSATKKGRIAFEPTARLMARF